MSKHMTLEYCHMGTERKIMIDDVMDTSLKGVWLSIANNFKGCASEDQDVLLSQEELSEFIEILTLVLNRKKGGGVIMNFEFYYPPVPPYKNGIAPGLQIIAYKHYNNYILQKLNAQIIREFKTKFFARRFINFLSKSCFNIHWIGGENPLCIRHF